MIEHAHQWEQTGPDEVACRVCGLEPWQQDRFDVACEMERRAIRRQYRQARQRLGLLG